MLHLRRYFAALAALSALGADLRCGGRAVGGAAADCPARAGLGPRRTGGLSRDAHDIDRLFPPDAWERDREKVKVIETEQATLLIQDYRPTPDGKLTLEPCTVIFYSAAEPDGPNDSPRRPIVLQAKRGAVLEFDRALDLTRAQIGRVTSGRLDGPVRIFSPPTQPDGRDALHIETSNVQLDSERIYTHEAVAFRYGDSHGSGRLLTISLLRKEGTADDARAVSLGGVHTVELRYLDRLHIEAQGRGLLGESRPASGVRQSASGVREHPDGAAQPADGQPSGG